MTCQHDIVAMENAVADGMCPLCLAADNSRLRLALTRIATYGDEGANARLKSTGSYGAFDEPGSVQIAREVLEKE